MNGADVILGCNFDNSCSKIRWLFNGTSLHNAWGDVYHACQRQLAFNLTDTTIGCYSCTVQCSSVSSSEACFYHNFSQSGVISLNRTIQPTSSIPSDPGSNPSDPGLIFTTRVVAVAATCLALMLLILVLMCVLTCSIHKYKKQLSKELLNGVGKQLPQYRV